MADCPNCADLGMPDALSSRRSLASAPEQRNVPCEPRQPRLPKAFANVSFYSGNELVSTVDFLLRAFEALRRLRLQDRTVQRRIQIRPIGENLGQEKCALSERLCRASKRGDIHTHLDNDARRLQNYVGLLINDLKPVVVAFAVKRLAKLSDAQQPSYQPRSNRNCNPHRATTLVTPPSTSLHAGKAQCGDDCSDRTNSCPSVPPHHAPSFSGRPTRAYSIPPAHSLIPLWTGRHSAMPTRQEEIARG